MTPFRIVVLCGGTSAEREVSLGSGRAAAEALARSYPTRLQRIDVEGLPEGLEPEREIVFSTLHGTFGEDGGMQRLLDRAGVHYAGCDAAASALTFDKEATKRAVVTRGVRVAKGLAFAAAARPTAEVLVAEIGPDVVLKPRASGSSVGLAMATGTAEIGAVLARLDGGEWLAEQRIRGREVTVGILDGRALGVVEVLPESGVYDYTSKYTKGLTRFQAPADLPAATTEGLQRTAEAAYAACGCRDYARLDFMLSADGQWFFLEINTLPGMKDTSLLPMSARCVGIEFTRLVREMVAPALRRFSGVAASSDR
jgi:D-alanine-D-alanine ligase